MFKPNKNQCTNTHTNIYKLLPMAQGIEHHNSTVKCHAHSWNITNELDLNYNTDSEILCDLWKKVEEYKSKL